MTLHVKDGGTWRQAVGVYVKDSGVWRTCSHVYTKVAGVWQLVYQAWNYVAFGGLIDGSLIGATAYASVRFNPDGTIDWQAGNSTWLLNQARWASGTPPDLKLIRATLLSGALTSGVTGSWLLLNTPQVWTRTRATVGTSFADVQFDFMTSGGGSTEHTGTYYLQATRDA